jgi:hypothetical protein
MWLFDRGDGGTPDLARSKCLAIFRRQFMAESQKLEAYQPEYERCARGGALEHLGRDAPQMAPFSEGSRRVNLTALAASLALLSSNLFAVGVVAAKYTSYTSGEYGFSFQYPNDWTLKEGDRVKLSWGYGGPVGDSLPGGTTVVFVNSPPFSWEDQSGRWLFATQFLQVSIEAKLTPEQCYQSSFAGCQTPELDDPQGKFPTVKLGENQFTEAAHGGVGLGHQNISRYYHTFRNYLCYEFQLGSNEMWTMGSSDELEDDFSELKDVLATVKFSTPTLKVSSRRDTK